MAAPAENGNRPPAHSRRLLEQELTTWCHEVRTFFTQFRRDLSELTSPLEQKPGTAPTARYPAASQGSEEAHATTPSSKPWSSERWEQLKRQLSQRAEPSCGDETSDPATADSHTLESVGTADPERSKST